MQTIPTHMKRLLAPLFVIFAATTFAQTVRSGDFHLDKVYKVNEKGLVSLRTSDAKVFVTGSKRSDIRVKIDREISSKGLVMGDDMFTVNVDEQNGNIVIDERSSSNISIVGYYSEKYEIRIEAPQGVSLRIRGDDGDYFINTIGGAIDLDVDDADVEIAGCTGDNFIFRIDDGDIKMDQGRGTLEVSADDADVIIDNAQFIKISAELDDGDFIVQTSLQDGGDYYIDSQDGTISFTVSSGGGRFDIRHDDASVRVDDAFQRIEESDDRSRFSLGTGTAKVDIRADDARVRLATQ
jgi:hypothetical protein